MVINSLLSIEQFIFHDCTCTFVVLIKISFYYFISTFLILPIHAIQQRKWYNDEIITPYEDQFVVDVLPLRQIGLSDQFLKTGTALTLSLHLFPWTFFSITIEQKWSVHFVSQLHIIRSILEKSNFLSDIICVPPTSLKIVNTKHKKHVGI